MGLSKTIGAERMEATCHSFRSCEQSAQCPVLTLRNCADSTSALNKMLMVVVRNIFTWNNNVNVVQIHRMKRCFVWRQIVRKCECTLGHLLQDYFSPWKLHPSFSSSQRKQNSMKSHIFWPVMSLFVGQLFCGECTHAFISTLCPVALSHKWLWPFVRHEKPSASYVQNYTVLCILLSLSHLPEVYLHPPSFTHK